MLTAYFTTFGSPLSGSFFVAMLCSWSQRVMCRTILPNGAPCSIPAAADAASSSGTAESTTGLSLLCPTASSGAAKTGLKEM